MVIFIGVVVGLFVGILIDYLTPPSILPGLEWVRQYVTLKNVKDTLYSFTNQLPGVLRLRIAKYNREARALGYEYLIGDSVLVKDSNNVSIVATIIGFSINSIKEYHAVVEDIISPNNASKWKINDECWFHPNVIVSRWPVDMLKLNPQELSRYLLGVIQA